jgi:hypothetical protein
MADNGDSKTTVSVAALLPKEWSMCVDKEDWAAAAALLDRWWTATPPGWSWADLMEQVHRVTVPGTVAAARVCAAVAQHCTSSTVVYSLLGDLESESACDANVNAFCAAPGAVEAVVRRLLVVDTAPDALVLQTFCGLVRRVRGFKAWEALDKKTVNASLLRIAQCALEFSSEATAATACDAMTALARCLAHTSGKRRAKRASIVAPCVHARLTAYWDDVVDAEKAAFQQPVGMSSAVCAVLEVLYMHASSPEERIGIAMEHAPRLLAYVHWLSTHADITQGADEHACNFAVRTLKQLLMDGLRSGETFRRVQTAIVDHMLTLWLPTLVALMLYHPSEVLRNHAVVILVGWCIGGEAKWQPDTGTGLAVACLKQMNIAPADAAPLGKVMNNGLSDPNLAIRLGEFCTLAPSVAEHFTKTWSKRLPIDTQVRTHIGVRYDSADSKALQHCDGPQCSKYVCRQDDMATRFKVCARCKIATYCSAECQRNHWKARHKNECKTL